MIDIKLAQKKIDSMDIGEKKCIKEIYGDDWNSVADPRVFGKEFKKSVKNEELSNIKHLGIRSKGRCDEYERI